MSTDARMVECVLFIENEALELERICQMTGLDEKAAKRALKELDGVFRDSGHGIRLKENSDGSYEFAPCEDLYDMLRSTYGRKVDRRLTRAALETLSIIAYKQPITRREIDKSTTSGAWLLTTSSDCYVRGNTSRSSAARTCRGIPASMAQAASSFSNSACARSASCPG